ncbi:uncharacterized protein LOC144430418 [Styela clava]
MLGPKIQYFILLSLEIRIAISLKAPSSSFYYEKRGIGIFHDKVTYETASENCESWRGRLVVIDNPSLQSAIENHLKSSNAYFPSDWKSADPFEPGFYVGAHDRNNEGNWIWLNLNPVPKPGSEVIFWAK